MKKYKLIIFDWDGTLYDSAAHIVHCMQKTAREFNVEPPTAETLRQVIGLSFEKAMEQVFPEMKDDSVQAFASRFRAHIYANDLEKKPTLFEGTEEVLKQLAKEEYWLAIATGKNRSGLESELETLKLRKLFLAIRSAGETQSKPHPQMLLEILDELGIGAHEALMIGDTIYDLEMAAHAKVDALAVNYGVHDESALKQYEIKGCLSDIRQLPEWVAHNNKFVL